ncbi:MAG: L-lactate dehydrogenase [Phaeodactylibacter sp.]|uniref:L-lactate dehydrogenase n=1 Tax=Phaeodactylibacter sp. TaxID=1940289 RepID=UPI0032EAB915
MPSDRSTPRKVVIVGAGAVGATFAYALAQSGAANSICLIDQNQKLAEGQVADLSHGLPYYPSVSITNGTTEDYGDAQVVVITAGSAQRPGETRLDLLKRNASIIEGIMDEIIEQQSRAIVVIVTNPVDVLTQVALRHSRWSRSHIFGSGTVLDSARFRYFISQEMGVDVKSVHAYILGEHGDSELPAWSLTNLGGVAIQQYVKSNGLQEQWPKRSREIFEAVKNSAYHIIDYKGATNFAVGQALVRIVQAILRDSHSVLTVSIQLRGEYGIEGVCLSVPCIVSKDGVEKVLVADLSEEEQQALKHSASVLKDSMKGLLE